MEILKKKFMKEEKIKKDIIFLVIKEIQQIKK